MAVCLIFIIFAVTMEKIKDINDSGVLISQDAIENSLHKKAQRKLTLAQLPVYRATGNLKYVIIGIAKNAQRSLRSGENRAGNQFLSRLLRTSSIISDTQGEHHQPR